MPGNPERAATVTATPEEAPVAPPEGEQESEGGSPQAQPAPDSSNADKGQVIRASAGFLDKPVEFIPKEYTAKDIAAILQQKAVPGQRGADSNAPSDEADGGHDHAD